MNTLTKLSLITFLGMFFCVPQGVADNHGRHKWQDHDDKSHHNENRSYSEKYLYVWAGDQARDSPDFLAVINFDEKSDNYGEVINTVPLPPPGNTNNEPHHCHLSKDKNILACGGLLSLLHNQNSIYFFDVSNPKTPQLISSTKAVLSDITDDFLPLDSGGFLVTNMGSNTGFTPGKLVEYDAHLGLVDEWPILTPKDGSTLDYFNPHGVSARPEAVVSALWISN